MFVVSWQPHVTQPLEQSGLTVTGLEWTLQLMPPEPQANKKHRPCTEADSREHVFVSLSW